MRAAPLRTLFGLIIGIGFTTSSGAAERCADCPPDGARNDLQLAAAGDPRTLTGQERHRFGAVGQFTAPGVGAATGTVVVRRDIVVTSAGTFAAHGRWRASLHSYRFSLGEPGKDYQVLTIVMGTRSPESNPWADWAVVRLTAAVDPAIQPVKVRRFDEASLLDSAESTFQIAFEGTSAKGHRPVVHRCEVRRRESGAPADSEVSARNCFSGPGTAGAPLLVPSGNALYLGMIQPSRGRTGLGQAASRSQGAFGIRVDGPFYDRIVRYING